MPEDTLLNMIMQKNREDIQTIFSVWREAVKAQQTFRGVWLDMAMPPTPTNWSNFPTIKSVGLQNRWINRYYEKRDAVQLSRAKYWETIERYNPQLKQKTFKQLDTTQGHDDLILCHLQEGLWTAQKVICNEIIDWLGNHEIGVTGIEFRRETLSRPDWIIPRLCAISILEPVDLPDIQDFPVKNWRLIRPKTLGEACTTLYLIYTLSLWDKPQW